MRYAEFMEATVGFTAPGTNMVAYSGFCPGNGMVSRACALMLVPSVAFSVFRIAPALDATLTVVEALPTVNFASIFAI